MPRRLDQPTRTRLLLFGLASLVLLSCTEQSDCESTPTSDVPFETITSEVQIQTPGRCLYYFRTSDCGIPVSLGDAAGFRSDKPTFNAPPVTFTNLDPGSHTVSLDVPPNCELQSPHPVTSSGEPVTFDLVCTGVTIGVKDVELNNDPSGAGTVTSDPAGIQCMLVALERSGTCEMVLPETPDVTLTAAAATGSELERWITSEAFGFIVLGNCNGSAPGPCTLGAGPGLFSITTLDVFAHFRQVGPQGSILVSVVTDGVSLDPDGYSLTVGGETRDIGITSQELFDDLVTGEAVEVLLGGLAPNCTVDEANPQTVTVLAVETVVVDFTVTCVAAGPTGALEVTTVTTGGVPPPRRALPCEGRWRGDLHRHQQHRAS